MTYSISPIPNRRRFRYFCSLDARRSGEALAEVEELLGSSIAQSAVPQRNKRRLIPCTGGAMLVFGLLGTIVLFGLLVMIACDL